MTGNLSRTVLRGAGARESACLPDVTNLVYPIGQSQRILIKTIEFITDKD